MANPRLKPVARLDSSDSNITLYICVVMETINISDLMQNALN